MGLGFRVEGPFGDFPKLGVPFGGPYKKDYSILKSILGSPYFGKLPNPSELNLYGWDWGLGLGVKG